MVSYLTGGMSRRTSEGQKDLERGGGQGVSETNFASKLYELFLHWEGGGI